MPQKFTCIIDASSYINLSSIEIHTNGKTLLDLLSSEVVFRFCSTVNQELARHYGRNMPDSLTRSNSTHQINTRSLAKYEKGLFGSISQTPQNKGEKHNFVVMLDLFLSRKQSGFIFLIDDASAKRNIFSNLFPALF
jgi:hypothetical protein